MEQLWAKVIDSVGRASPFIRGYLSEAHPVSFDKNLLTIGFDPEFADHLDLVDNAKNRTVIQTKLKELGFGDAQTRFIKAEAPVKRRATAPSPGRPYVQPPPGAPFDATPKPAVEAAASPLKAKPEPVPFNKDEFKNDPLIQKALEVFKGQIVEVRA